MLGSFVLPLLIGLPLLGAIFVMCTPKTETSLHRGLGLLFTTITFLVSLLCCATSTRRTRASSSCSTPSGSPASARTSRSASTASRSSSSSLTTFLMPLTLLGTAKSIEKHTREFIAAMLVLEAGMLGAFVALDLFLFYVLWEVMLIPMYLLIGIWGGQRRLYASIKFVIYTMVGSLLMLVAIFYVYVQYGDVHRHVHDRPREADRRSRCRTTRRSGASRRSRSRSRSRSRCSRCTRGCPTRTSRRRPRAR